MAEESILNLERFTNILQGTTQTAVGLGGALLTGQQNMGAYSEALSSTTDALGGMGKTIGKVVNGLVQFAEESLKEYQTLSAIGATFGKEMVDIKVAAAEMGMSVQEMTQFLGQNNKSLRAFGGTTDMAISRFRELNNLVLNTQELGTELRKLGYTTTDIAEGLALYGEISDANARSDRRSAAEQAASAKEFMVQLDGLAKLTGKQREQIADEMKERRRAGDINAFLMGKSEEDQAAFTAQLAEIQAKLGKDAADAFVDLTLRGAPTTEQTRGALLAMGGGAEELYAAASAFNSGNIDQFTNSIDAATASAMEYQRSEDFRNTAVLGGLSTVSNAFSNASAASYDYANTLEGAAEPGETAAQTQARLQNQILDEQYVQMKTTTGILDETIRTQEALRDLSVTAMETVMPRLEDVAMAGLEKFRAAIPSSDEIAQKLAGAVDGLFDMARLADRESRDPMNVVVDGQQDLSQESTQQEVAQSLGAEIEDSKERDSETQAAIQKAQEAVEDAKVAVFDAETRVNELQEQKANMLATGLQETDGAVIGVSQQLAEAEAKLQAAIREQAQASAVAASHRLGFGGKLFRGGRAEGGPIGANEFAMVGEAGPEFISGPANVMSAKTSMGVMQNLMKTIRNVESTVQESNNNVAQQISTNAYSGNAELGTKMDKMIDILNQLVFIEGNAVTTQQRTYRATKGLQSNMMRGL